MTSSTNSNHKQNSSRTGSQVNSTSERNTGHPGIPRRRLLGRALGGLLLFTPFAVVLAQGRSRRTNRRSDKKEPDVAVPRLVKSEAEWRKLLTPEQFNILREAGTERAFENQYNTHKDNGTYACVGCGNRLFDSSAKFDSGTGWPSFFKPLDSAAVVETPENNLIFRRVEVSCSRCGGHLGHVFKDGPRPTGLRYCMNSAALTFFEDRLGTSGPGSRR